MPRGSEFCLSFSALRRFCQRNSHCSEHASGGLPIVNGASITKPILSALADATVDIPVMLGNVGWETGDAPTNIVDGSITSEGWTSYLNSSFATLPGAHSDAEIAQLVRTVAHAFEADLLAIAEDDTARLLLKGFDALEQALREEGDNT